MARAWSASVASRECDDDGRVENYDDLQRLVAETEVGKQIVLDIIREK